MTKDGDLLVDQIDFVSATPTSDMPGLHVRFQSAQGVPMEVRLILDLDMVRKLRRQLAEQP